MLLGAALIAAWTAGCEHPSSQHGMSSNEPSLMSPTESHSATNRLIHEKSPYLLQHAHNPVDWYPWGDEAFAKAAREDKPVFLSIGYSTCHWCHVMERESFEDPGIAKLLNESFISIKVDREEHPDVDQLYMQAVTALTGQGGWPLTVLLTPDRQPFFGGTYFPPQRRGTMPGMTELLPAIAEAWKTRRASLLQSAEQLTSALQEEAAKQAPSGSIGAEALTSAFNHAVTSFDDTYGGFGEAPKFPRAHELSFLLHDWARMGSAQALEMVTTTLDHLARGGIRDHLGGGFHRYSTDAMWLVPHFEKMLYDQALLARAYLEAYRATRRAEYATVAREIFDYVLRDLTDPAGGFYSAEDADSEGREGAFYVWTPEELAHVLGAEDAELFARFYGVAHDGNFEQNTSILHIEQPLEVFARLKGLDASQLARRLAESRAKLLRARAQRIRPHRDDKILTSWNGLMIASLAEASTTLEEPRYLDAARRAADFLLGTLRRDGVLLRRFREGEARFPGTLEDYAFLAYGLSELYEASFEPRYLAEARDLARAMIQHFGDQEGGGFFLRATDEPTLIVRSKALYDGATPSGNSIAALVCLRLGRLTSDESLEAYGRKTLETFAQLIERAPFAYPQMLIAWDEALGPTREVVIAGDVGEARTRALLRVLQQRLLPRTVIIVRPSSAGPARQALEAIVPAARAQEPINGQPAAYVCERFVCLRPTTDPETLAAQLNRREAP